MSEKTVKLVLLIIISLFSVTFSSAQSLQDNPDYRMSVKLKIDSKNAFEEGDYEVSTKLAKESLLYAKKSDDWISMMKNKYRANSALKLVKKRLVTAKRLNAKTNFPEEYKKGETLYDQANQLYKDESFIESYPISMEALEIMKVIEYVKTSTTTLPAAYKVMYVPGDEDCLWNIAEFKNIYGDATEWKVLYEANKDILPEPDNPHLITLGMILTIPSINGEERSGTWVNGSIQ